MIFWWLKILFVLLLFGRRRTGAGELLARGLASRDERNAGDDVVGNRAGRS